MSPLKTTLTTFWRAAFISLIPLAGKVLNGIHNTGDLAVYAVNGGDFLVDQNYIGQNVGSTIIGDGVKMENVTGGTIKRNRISNATQVVETDHA